MWPAFMMLAVGRRWPFPWPLFLLWPLVALGWLVVGFCRLLGVRDDPDARGIGTLRLCLALFAELHGLQVDVASSEGRNVVVRFL